MIYLNTELIAFALKRISELGKDNCVPKALMSKYFHKIKLINEFISHKTRFGDTQVRFSR